MSMEISKRMSGRYPWGEGVEAFPNALAFAMRTKELMEQGFSYMDAAKQINAVLPDERKLSMTEFRIAKKIAGNRHHEEEVAKIRRLRDEGLSWSDISCKVKLPESVVRSMYANYVTVEERRNKRQKLFDALRTQAEKHGVVVVPYGECKDHGFSESWLDEIIYELEAEHGFAHFGVKCYLGCVTILAKPGVSRSYTLAHGSQIGLFDWSEGLDRATES